MDSASKKIPSGLVTGDHLKELCGKAGVLTEVEQEDIMLGFVKLRLGNEVCVQDPESPGGLRPVDIASSPLSLNPDEKAHVLVRETLRLPSDILATIRLLPEKMTEGFMANSCMIDPSNSVIPAIPVAYCGGTPVSLQADECFFGISFDKI